jgi:hypothetical protein
MSEKGKKVELVFTDDSHTLLKPGDRGVVSFVDDTGTVFVAWEDGSNLGLIPEIDKWIYLEDAITGQ